MNSYLADIERSLVAEIDTAARLSLKGLFNKDPMRYEKYHIRFNDFLVDYSKNLVTDKIMALLLNWAQAKKVPQAVQAMFNGEKINTTENRAVLHTALRHQDNTPVYTDGKDVMPDVQTQLDAMHAFTDAVRQKRFVGATGRPLTHIVNIGIGGSDLGPKMVVHALEAYRQKDLDFYFVSNIDGDDLADVLTRCPAQETLFIISSKTFTTLETLTNAKTARQWLVAQLGAGAVKNHFAAVSTNLKAVQEFGIDPANVFGFWDFVGGRYSVWSAIGLSVMMAIGYDHFRAFLSGAFEMDRHFLHAPLDKNIPVILGLIGAWYSTFMAAETYAVLPYSQRLSDFPAYLQQLDMESNGKGVNKKGARLQCFSGPIVFGAAGTNGQHSFYQLIHQGTHLIPCDFIAPIQSDNDLPEHQKLLLANFLAQPEALMMGRTRADLIAQGVDKKQLPHRIFTGNRPSNSILFDALTPRNLGTLIALYEHKVFVQGVLWGVNSFDQWGVELGKKLGLEVYEVLQGREKPHFSASTNALIDYVKGL